MNALTYQPAAPVANGYHRSLNRLLPSRAIPLPFGGDRARIRAVYQLGRVMSLGVDYERVLGGVSARVDALALELKQVEADWQAWTGREEEDGYVDALAAFSTARNRINAATTAAYWDGILIMADHLIDHFESDFEGLNIDPHDPNSLWQLEPEEAERIGTRPVLEFLVSPKWLQEVAKELTDPKLRA